MITDIPTSDDMTLSGVNLLNLAWSIGVNLITDLKSDEMLTDLDGLTKVYWQKSQPALMNVFAVIDQAIETLLKARIASISPFLLLDGTRAFPKKAAIQDVPFSDLTTIGGGGLFALHNTVCSLGLPSTFDTFVKDIRRRRNVIMHQPSASGPVKVGELFTLVVQTYGHLFPGERWLDTRLSIQCGNPRKMPWSPHTWPILSDEMELLTGFLEPDDLRICFVYDKDATACWCPDCKQKFAQLSPNDPASTKLHCCLCDATNDVIRLSCPDCGGDVASAEEAEGQPAATKCLCCLSLDLK
jgi:hypothetical protein